MKQASNQPSRLYVKPPEGVEECLHCDAIEFYVFVDAQRKTVDSICVKCGYTSCIAD